MRDTSSLLIGVSLIVEDNILREIEGIDKISLLGKLLFTLP